MTAQSTIALARHEPELLGQTVVVIGGSAGIGLETRGQHRRFRCHRLRAAPEVLR
jgi:hypothetical protein